MLFHHVNRFNRDIVECKALSERINFVEICCFNRDIVECKGGYRDGLKQGEKKF